MNTRERFIGTLDYGYVDRVPDLEFGYWQECFAIWREQGLPGNIDDNWDAERYFGFEYYKSFPAHIGLFPTFEHEVLEETGDRRLVRDSDGVIYEESISSRSIPKYVKFPLETREDWERIRDERLDPDNPDRIPADVERHIDEAKSRDYPLAAPCGSIYGWLRNWMGVENLSIAIMEDRDWVEEMMEHLANLTVSVLSRVADRVEFDFGFWWEDMCYNHGPLVSPRFFNEAMAPRYKKITSFLSGKGVRYHVLDCDGNIHELVPGWLESGINVMFPLEAAHTDQARLRSEYGRDLRVMGGVNKVALIRGKDAIDRELARVEALMEDGGYIPHVDHRCPPDVTLENYRYYVRRKRSIIGRAEG